MKRAFCLMFGLTFFIFGLLGAGIDVIAQGDLRGKIIGVTVGLLVTVFGVWLMRRVEKSYAKLLEAILSLLLINWP